MRRRDLITFFGVAAAWAIGSTLQAAFAAEPPKNTILHSGFPNRTPIHLLIEALAKLGYEDNRTAKIDLLGGEGDPFRLKSLVEQLGAQRPDVIIAITSPAVVALKDAKLRSLSCSPSCLIRSGLGSWKVWRIQAVPLPA